MDQLEFRGRSCPLLDHDEFCAGFAAVVDVPRRKEAGEGKTGEGGAKRSQEEQEERKMKWR